MELVKWVEGYKTYFVAALIVALGVLDEYGVELPAFIWPTVYALGLGFLRAGIKQAQEDAAALNGGAK